MRAPFRRFRVFESFFLVFSFFHLSSPNFLFKKKRPGALCPGGGGCGLGRGRVLVLNGKERERGRDEPRERKKEGKKEEKCKKFFCTSSAAAALHLKYFPSFSPFYLLISLLASEVAPRALGRRRRRRRARLFRRSSRLFDELCRDGRRGSAALM